jgi:hypothetical protein
VEDEVFEMDELAVDPQRGTRVGILRAFDPSASDRRASKAFVETGERDAGLEKGGLSSLKC